jgi:hypothetical protein
MNVFTVGFGGRICVYPMDDMDIEEFGVLRITFWYLCDRWAYGNSMKLADIEGSKVCVWTRYVSMAFENRKKGPSPAGR